MGACQHVEEFGITLHPTHALRQQAGRVAKRAPPDQEHVPGGRRRKQKHKQPGQHSDSSSSSSQPARQQVQQRTVDITEQMAAADQAALPPRW